MIKIFSLLVISVFFLPVGIAIAEETIPADVEDAGTQVIVEESTDAISGTERDLLKNPCSNIQGVEFRRCILKNNKLVQRQEARRILMLQRRATGRRVEALKAKQEQIWSTFDSPMNPGIHIDLREQALPETRTLRDWSDATSPTSEASGEPSIRIRAKSGMRNDAALSLPICSMRHGTRLVACLRMMNIPIVYPGTKEQPATVDKDTWNVYERMYLRNK